MTQLLPATVLAAPHFARIGSLQPNARP
jgi:hypothetical protein